MSGAQRKEQQKPMKTNHRLAALIACVAAACVLAACGSASSGSSSKAASGAAASTGGRAARSKLVACLKQHGVTLPSRAGGFRPSNGAGNGGGTPPAGGPPPGGAGGGFFFGGGAGGGGRFRTNPKLEEAFKACGANFGAGRRFRFNPAQRKMEINNFVKCVRQHGYNLPTPNLAGNGSVFPKSIESNKKFQAASRSCASILRPTGPAGGAPPGGQSTT